MGMRITTNMIRRNYTNNLMQNIGGLEKARKQVDTGRRFQWSYEDPSAAAKGMILERRNARTADYINTVKNGQKWIDSQSDILSDLSKYANQIDESEFTAAMNDPAGTVGRDAFAQNLRELQNSGCYGSAEEQPCKSFEYPVRRHVSHGRNRWQECAV